MIKLYLARHGETYGNVEHILQGHQPGELNAMGIRQAEELRDKIAGEGIEVFVSSDLGRAIQTCKIVAQPYGNVDINTTPLLRERDWGSLTGFSADELKNGAWPDDVESVEQMQQRAARFIDYLRQNYPEKRVLAVGHSQINRAIRSIVFGIPMHEIERMNNADVRVLSV